MNACRHLGPAFQRTPAEGQGDRPPHLCQKREPAVPYFPFDKLTEPFSLRAFRL